MYKKNNNADRWLWGITIFLVLIGTAIVYRRLALISTLNIPDGYTTGVTKSRSPVPDAGFATYPF
jgi:hypothetical protein